MEQINLIGAVLAGLAAFVLGGLWYSPALFGKSWMEAADLSEDQVKSASVLKMVLVTAPLSIISALVFAAFLGKEIDVVFGSAAGVAAGAFWVSGSFAINYVFEQKPLKLFWINSGYHTLQFTLYGAIIGLTNAIL